MRSGMIAFLFGVLLLQQLRELPDPFSVQFLPLLLLVAAVNRTLRFPALFACGLLWALFRAELMVARTLPMALEGRDLTVEGTVASMPRRDALKTSFRFDVVQLRDPIGSWGSSARILLNWYDETLELIPGDRWVLTVHLKRPHGFMNPGGFDYERWLFQQGISATGYVRSRGVNRRIESETGYHIDRFRSRLASAIDRALGETPYSAMVQALSLGSRDGIPESQWEVLRATGTGHLMAISGLHIGLIAAMAFFLSGRLWSLPGHTVLAMAAPRVAALAAIVAALGYATLAGFSIPTRRALVMVCVIMAGVFLRRNMSPSLSLAWALALVLLWDPFAVLSVGFWLSFAAVAVILFGMTLRLSARGLWWKWGRVQWLVAVGLLPLTLLFFQQQPLIAPLANLVAVPWMGMVVVPMILLGVGLLIPLPGAGAVVLQWAALGIDLLWPVLVGLADLDLVYRGPSSPPLWAFLAGAVGGALILLPRGVPGRWLGIPWLLPLFLLPVSRPSEGEIWFTLLDVGQGLSVVVRTREHVLVYDTGPSFSPRFNAGSAVLVPFLLQQGIRSVDTLILSHGDTDHLGGLESLLAAIPVRQVMGSVAEKLSSAVPCRRDEHWQWNGVEFRVLHPPPGDLNHGNNDSCVLRVAGPGGTVLLPGDIERNAEDLLVRAEPDRLGADILVVPHHGSRTSSSEVFLDAVDPVYALFSVGYRNRFSLPHPDVVKRYITRQVRCYESTRHGAITFKLAPRRGVLSTPYLYRLDKRRFWHQCDECSDGALVATHVGLQ